MLALSLLAIVAAIVLGFKLKINIGIFGAIFALLIGTMGLGLSINAVIAFWPMKILFYMMVITLFYGFAVSNGTMDVLGKKLIHQIRGRSALVLPISLIACVLLGWGGAQAIPLLGPLVFAIAYSCNLSPLATAITVPIAYNMGADNPLTGQGGIIATNLIADAGYENGALVWGVYMNAFLKQALLFLAVYFLFKCYKGKDIDTSGEAPKFNRDQKTTLIIILCCVAITVLAQIFATLAPKVAFFKLLKKIFQPQITFLFGIVACMLFKVGNYKKALQNIPQNSILLIGGMCMLMEVATKAGLVDTVGGYVSENLPAFLIPAALCLFAGFLSAFSSGTSVVCPLLFPLVPALCAGTGLNPVALFSCIYVGAMSTAISPFSSAGAQKLSFCPDEEVQSKLAYQLLVAAVVVCLVCSLLSSLGLFNIIASLFKIY